MKSVCDLHVHSCFSDGTCTPKQLIEIAERIELSAIALCDHNTVAGVPAFLQAAKNCAVEAIPGIEFTTVYQEKELHVLALFVAQRYFAAINAKMADFLRLKDQSNIALVDALKRGGYAIDYDMIKAGTPNGQVNRAHIAAALVQKGYVASAKEAFSSLLNPGCGYYAPPERWDAFDAIRFIKSIGAVAVLAHPFLSLEEDMLRKFLQQAKQVGLDGMEVAYSKYDQATTELSSRIAKEFGLLPSGGSDYHGGNKPDIALGVGRGNLRVPSAWLDDLRQCIK